MKQRFQLLAAVALAAVAFNASAANQGTVGTTASSGDFLINLTISPAIVVGMLDDMDLSVDGATPGTPIVGRENICVGGIGATTYTVALDSANGSDGFTLLGNGGDTMPYKVNYANDTDIASTGDAATDNTAIAPAGGDYTLNETLACDTETSQVIVSVPHTSWEAATDSSYTDTLTVTVTAL
ncbi:hypothetical protein [Microbulbifer yueqingensis]|uniref:Spore coat protein U (SCPU) domain-containing protein n=1 Tax=Microbulbifer yueqingensis TaxID=658219 RepID=A0A1G8VML1_9GAMM|nr:hypothetical protein [Microbulbifer yueqingensis]SDJ67223.1 hypothetical protein SAMN05216212_0640 [Microbulbifer yueqingensis]